MKTYSELYGKEVELSYALLKEASQENCDGDPYDLMAIAANRIDELEKLISDFVLEIGSCNFCHYEKVSGIAIKHQRILKEVLK